MKRSDRLQHAFGSAFSGIKKYRMLLLTLSAVVVFVVSYLLVLPALTLEKDEAAKQGGISMGNSAVVEETAQEDVNLTQLDTDDSVPKAQSPDKPVKNPATASKGYKSGELTYDGKTYEVEAVFDQNAKIPEETQLKVKEIGKDNKQYKDYYEEVLKAIKEDAKGSASDLSFAKFYDITLRANGTDVEPADTVDVTISYDKGIAAADADHVHVLHFKEDPKSDKIKTEILDPDDVDVAIEKDKMIEASFKAESFSVYAIVYTVDFEYESDGEKINYSMDGEEAISLKELLLTLHVIDEKKVDADSFMDLIEDVSFSEPKYLAIVKAEDDTTLGTLKVKNHIQQDYAAWRDQGYVEEKNRQKFEAGDWALISLKPFSSKEKLTISLKNGQTLTVVVTDAQDAPMNEDGTVQTINNPSGTTIDLFDYWVANDRKDSFAREAWPGYYDGWYYHDENDYDWYKTGTLLGEGNEAGINAGHMFKFSPAWAGTVYNGTIPNKENADLLAPTRNPTNVDYANDGDRLYYVHGVNAYTGNGDPQQGLVQGTLDGGYPKLTNDPSLGTNGESLKYLFMQESANYKDYYPSVDNLLYVDKDGYYTYDSRDYKADLQTDGKNFKLTEQTSSDTEVRGFWPFGQQKFWVGMHMNTQFSMPSNGQVLNPKGEYKDMQFEFSGDDDTWLYIDGVLVGDGGGIHNRTEIDINFATGKVTVTGKKDTAHMGQFEEEAYLDDIFIEAGRYNDADWEDIGDGSGHKRFKAGTYHTFDMFYLERGGGESNLYIHYNLVSTEDFTAHKSYEGFAEDERMERNQFRFEMIGLDGQYQSVWNAETQTADVTLINENAHAIMPTQGTEGGAGTYEDPKKVYSESAWKNKAGTIFTTGVTENGDIRFGTAEINQEEMRNCDEGHPSLYRYIFREIVPDDAKNADGVMWSEATEAQKAAGGFVKDQVQYDGTIYYMTARVTSWDQTGADGHSYKQYGLSKTYYTDDTFTTVDKNTRFISFENDYAPDQGEVEFTKTDGMNQALAGATFTMYKDSACTKIAKDLDGVEQVITTGTDGKVVFDNIAAPRTYYMKETVTPNGYTPNDTLYKVVIEDSRDQTKQSKIIVDGDETQTPITKIVNTKDGELSVVKEWQDVNGKPVSGRDYTARVKIQRRYNKKIPNEHTVNFTIRIDNRSDLVYTYTARNVEGEVSVDWWDTNQSITSFEVKDNNNTDIDYTRSDYWDETNHKNRKVVVSTDSPEINITVTYPENVDWLFNSEHTPWMRAVSVLGSGDVYEPTEDMDFNSSEDELHFATLSSTNNWSKTWTIGSGKDFPDTDGTNPYIYYVIEIDENGQALVPGTETEDGYKLIGYSSNNTDGIIHEGAITVYNQVEITGVELPFTGSSGTPLIYLFGAIFTIMSTVSLVIRKRRKAV